jgi:hypothetical protein
MRWNIACASLAAFLLAPLTAKVAQAAEIKLVAKQDGDLHPAVITVNGPLVIGDDVTFRQTMGANRSAIVFLDSPGGFLDAGLSIGRVIKKNGFVTAVVDHAACNSACALAWLGGKERYIGEGALVGFHATRSKELRDSGNAAAAAAIGNALVGFYLHELGFPERTITYVMMAKPQSMTYLTHEDSVNYGIAYNAFTKEQADRYRDVLAGRPDVDSSAPVPVDVHAHAVEEHHASAVQHASPAVSEEGKKAQAEVGMDVPPLVGFTGSADTIDAALQATPLWRILKREFPDWYSERLKEATSLAEQKTDDAVIGLRMAKELVVLRRKNVDQALSASFAKLKAVALTFYDNVVGLQKQSNDACFAYISQGEATTASVALLRGSPHVARLQAQLTAEFEAIADGRSTPHLHPKPDNSDYGALASELLRRGWTQADMQLFADQHALAHAGAAKVCQMVRDWYAAQLAISDPDMQLRLLVNSLKPLFTG